MRCALMGVKSGEVVTVKGNGVVQSNKRNVTEAETFCSLNQYICLKLKSHFTVFARFSPRGSNKCEINEF